MNASDPGPARRQARVGLIPTPAPCTTWPHQAPSGLLDGLDPSGWIADKGYIGKGMITPHKKPPNGELSEAAQEANKSINQIRQAERADHRPHQGLENPLAPTTAAPCTHSNRPSPPHSHSTSSKPPSE